MMLNMNVLLMLWLCSGVGMELTEPSVIRAVDKRLVFREEILGNLSRIC